MSSEERCDICNKLLVNWLGQDSIYHENYYSLSYCRTDEIMERTGVFCSKECLKKFLEEWQ
jgi:hypothetical protein